MCVINRYCSGVGSSRIDHWVHFQTPDAPLKKYWTDTRQCLFMRLFKVKQIYSELHILQRTNKYSTK